MVKLLARRTSVMEVDLAIAGQQQRRKRQRVRDDEKPHPEFFRVNGKR
jgi:hypothetical protein